MIEDQVYYDINGGNGTGIDTGNQDAFLKSVLNSKPIKSNQTILRHWAEIATHIFEDNADYAARIHACGDFRKNFMEKPDEAGYAALQEVFGTSYENGDKCWDYTKATDLQLTDSLSKVRTKAADSIANAIQHKTTGADILAATDDNNALKVLDDKNQRDVLYTLVTCVDAEGISNAYHYNAFGLAFYDFN